MKYIELPASENPRNRIRDLGGPSLSTSEALSVALWITDTDQANELAALYREYGSLAAIPRHQVVKIKGLGERYADALAAIVELARREMMASKPDRVKIHSPSDAADLVQYEMSALEQEQMRVILLNTRNEVMRVVTLYQGSLNAAQLRISEVMRDAIREQAAAFIVVHNHPSGDPTPSPEDVSVTRAIVQAAKLMDLDFLDHLIIGYHKWTSLKERGLGF